MIVVIKASRLIMTITESQKSDMEGDKLSQVSFLKEGGGGGRERERERERFSRSRSFTYRARSKSIHSGL
jgi:hypothetical protein